jgi:hypothetical protein
MSVFDKGVDEGPGFRLDPSTLPKGGDRADLVARTGIAPVFQP